MPQERAALKMQRYIVFALCLFASSIHAQTVIFPFASSWKYLDNGTDQGVLWKGVTFDQTSWKSGAGQFGYGSGNNATVVSYGGNASAKNITTYFRKVFNITGKNNYASFKLEFKRDDGILIYVNGTELKRDNMPSGIISYTTKSSTSATDDGTALQTATFLPASFVEGSNTIAAEIHQCSANSSDITFDMQLTGLLTPPAAALDSITRGPYLQMVNQGSITIRWATKKATDSKIKWGTVAGTLGSSITDTAKKTEHEMRLTGLFPDTKYFYSVGNSAAVLEQTDKNFFVTAPPATTSRKIRIAAYGDCGNNSSNQVNVKNAYLNYMGSNTTDLWLLLGDNAYYSGLSSEYESNFFNVYKNDLLKNITVFPSLGNHDYANNASRQDDHNIPYFSFFTLPQNGESGGQASGKKEYYSFDYGDIHFICLDSYGEEQNKRLYDTSSAQVLWLKKDLAANQRKWTIAYWHHPPYTMGSHNSDSESDLAGVRTKLARILERNGVDLILNGHSHSYERSYFLHDHFGLENTFSFAANANGSSNGKYDGSANSCPYKSVSAKVKHGTVYVVAGSAGQRGGTQSSFPHAAMYYSDATTGGSLAIEIQGNRLDAKFVAADNTIKDQFTILKDVDKTSSKTITAGQTATLTASWTGNYNWNTGSTSKSLVITQPTVGNYNYYVRDNSNTANRCISDTFQVKVIAAALRSSSTVSAPSITATPDLSFTISPKPANGRKIHLEITSGMKQNVRYDIADINGRTRHKNTIVVQPGITQKDLIMDSGVYFLTLSNTSGFHKTEKIVVE